MDDQIVPDTVSSLADEVASEAAQFKACLGLMHEVLQVNTYYLDDEPVKDALEQIHFLTSGLDRIQNRINILAAAAYDIHERQKAAA